MERPLLRPWTSSVARRFGAIPAVATKAVPRLRSAATRFGRLRLYIHRLDASLTCVMRHLFQWTTDGLLADSDRPSQIGGTHPENARN